MKYRFVPIVLILLIGSIAKGQSMPMPEFSNSGVSDAASALVAKYFRDANDRLKKIVLDPTGRTAAAREFRAARAAQQIQQIDQILTGLKARTSGWVGVHVPAAMRDGIALAHEQAIKAGVRPPEGLVAGSFTKIDQRTALVLAMDTTMALHNATDSMGDRAKTVLRQTAQEGLAESDINRILAGGVIEGKPVQTIRLLREELQRVHGDQVEINGRNYDVRKYAETVVRTKTRQATVKARHGRLEALGLDLVAIVGKVSDSFCTAFLGQVFSLSGKSNKYPAYSSLPGGGPPFHPNCSKSTRPFVAELATEKQLDQADLLESSGKLLGMNAAEAQKSYKDLQIRGEIKGRYATTAAQLF